MAHPTDATASPRVLLRVHDERRAPAQDQVPAILHRPGRPGTCRRNRFSRSSSSSSELLAVVVMITHSIFSRSASSATSLDERRTAPYSSISPHLSPAPSIATAGGDVSPWTLHKPATTDRAGAGVRPTTSGLTERTACEQRGFRHLPGLSVTLQHKTLPWPLIWIEPA